MRQAIRHFALVLLIFTPGLIEAAEPGRSKLCLWKVEGKTNTVHLFGSIHFLRKEFYPLPEPVEKAYAAAQVVAFETDLEAMDNPEVQLKMVQRGQLPEGETIEQHLSKETYKKLQEYLEKAIGLGTLFDSFQPWMAAMTLALIEITKLGFDPSQGVDKHFHTRAKADARQIVALESAESQINLLAGMSRQEQELLMKETLEDIGRFKTMFDDVIEAWRTGDALKLDQLISENLRSVPALHKKLLMDRNEQWLPKIESMLKGGQNAFVVVGAAHLVGTNSVVELLQKKGFKVTQEQGR
jgi:uncharacterized protein